MGELFMDKNRDRIACDSFDEQLNFVLSQSYGLITRIEKHSLSRSKKFKFTLSELKMLEAVSAGGEKGRLIGSIAQDLYITPSTVTIGVNRLEKKGYVVRKRGEDDGRHVYVHLTDTGKHAVRVHKRFHKSFANSISKDITEEEREMLIKCIEGMNEFIADRIKKFEGKTEK